MSSLLFVLIATTLVPILHGADLPDPVLVGGSPSFWGSFPSAAFIRTPFASYCGAVVIHSEFVLTLAQCVYDEQKQTALVANQLDVIAGDIAVVPKSIYRQQRDVLEVIVHDNFTAYNHRNDIALLRVDRPFQMPSNTVEVAIRRSQIVPNGASCQLPGWGVQQSTSVGAVETDQKYLTVEILDRDICNQANIHGDKVRESMICAGNLYQNTNAACSGNLGSPLFCDDEVTGLMSFGVNCGLANDPPVFTQVRFFNRWIDEQIAKRNRDV